MSRIRKDEYRKAAENRLEDANVLKNQKRYHSMVYLSGFALECALAYYYCVKNVKEYIEEVKGYDSGVWYKHNLGAKLKATGLDLLYKDDMEKVTKEWTVTMRYKGNLYTSKKDQERAEKLFEITKKIYKNIKAHAL